MISIVAIWRHHGLMVDKTRSREVNQLFFFLPQPLQRHLQEDERDEPKELGDECIAE